MVDILSFSEFDHKEAETEWCKMHIRSKKAFTLGLPKADLELQFFFLPLMDFHNETANLLYD